jgi:hypothetical protein
MLEHGAGDLEKLQNVLGSLPVKGIPREHCPVTRENGYRAPYGKAFRISGQFWRQMNFFNDYNNPAPRPSVSAFIAANQADYDWLMAEFGDNEQRALRELKGDKRDYSGEYDDLPEEFIGKWLVISAGRPVSIRVKQDIVARTERQNSRIINDLTSETRMEPIWMQEFGDGEVVWNQHYAEAVGGECQIELVDYEEEEQPLWLPEPVDHSRIERVEYLQAASSEELSSYYSIGLGRDLTNSERLELMRERRWWGNPLSDDPLKYLIMPERRVLKAPKPDIVLPERPKRGWIITLEQEKYLN